MSKVISANQFLYSVDELIDIFNSLLQKEITSATEFRHKVISKGCEHLDMCGGGMISVWVTDAWLLKILKRLLNPKLRKQAGILLSMCGKRMNVQVWIKSLFVLNQANK